MGCTLLLSAYLIKRYNITILFQFRGREIVKMDLMTLAMELIVGRLVLDLPKEDLKKVNEMIKKNLER